MKASKKNLSIELLRIISMIMIIAYHWQIHGNDDSIYKSQLTANQVFSFIIGSWGTLGVNIFFIISAYFLLHNSKVNLSKIICLVCKVSIYGTAVVLLTYMLGVVPFDILTLFKSLLGVFAYQYWFITVYLVVYIIHPALNKIIEITLTKYLLFLLFTMIVVTYIIGFVFQGEFLGRLSCGVTIYLTVGVLEKQHEHNWISNHCKSGMFLLLTGIVLLEIILSYLGNNYSPAFFACIRRMQDTHSPIMFLTALFVFYSFLNHKIDSNRAIEFFGKYSVGAYLIHGGASFIKDYLWDGLFKAGIYYNQSFFVYASHYVLCVVILLLIGVMVECIYCKSIDNAISKVTMKLGVSQSIEFYAPDREK